MADHFSLSTQWMHGRFETIADFVAAAERCGFNNFELDSSIWLRTIADVSLPDNQIPSLEIPCPAHPRNYDARFASLDRYEREAAREAALNSFQLAYDLNADILLVKLGQVEVNPAVEVALHKTWQAGEAGSESFQDLRRELIDTRARNASPHLKAALYDIEYLANLAVDHNVKLGIVTPMTYLALPLPEEMQIILEEFGDPVYYWHDTLQTAIFDTLGLMPRQTWLDMFVKHIAGVHLHPPQKLTQEPDTENNSAPSEKAPSVKQLKRLAEILPKEAFLTCKFSAKNTPEQVTEGLAQIKEIFRQRVTPTND